MEPESKQPETPPKAHFPLPDKMPVMVLSNCFLLPGCFLPLFIFEERYRLMLKHALETDRMFCVGIRKRSSGNCSKRAARFSSRQRESQAPKASRTRRRASAVAGAGKSTRSVN